MQLTALLGTDGSELAIDALRAGLAVIRVPDRVVVATVSEPHDPMLVTGAGMAAGVMSPDQFEAMERAREQAARDVLDRTRTALELRDAEAHIVVGSPGPSLCELAEALPASVILLGTRGRGGLKRAVLGSVSDYVVRHAHCPVVTSGPD